MYLWKERAYRKQKRNLSFVIFSETFDFLIERQEKVLSTFLTFMGKVMSFVCVPEKLGKVNKIIGFLREKSILKQLSSVAKLSRKGWQTSIEQHDGEQTKSFFLLVFFLLSMDLRRLVNGFFIAVLLGSISRKGFDGVQHEIIQIDGWWWHEWHESVFGFMCSIERNVYFYPWFNPQIYTKCGCNDISSEIDSEENKLRHGFKLLFVLAFTLIITYRETFPSFPTPWIRMSNVSNRI